jgi:phosphate transport system substrate-binding protein
MSINWKALVMVALCAVGAAAGFKLIAAGQSPRRAQAESGRLSGRLVITGSSTTAPLVKAIAQRFCASNPGVQIEVQTGGSARGLADVRAGTSSIGMSSKVMTDREADLFGYPIARDGVSLMVHKSNPVTELSKAQVADIYSGKITRWGAVGGRDEAISVIMRPEGRGVYELFMQYFKLDAQSVRPGRVVGENRDAIKAVVEDANAIVFLSIAEAERNAAEGVPLKLLPMAGIEATTANLRQGNFPISRPLTLITKGRPEGLAKQFIEYSLSPQAIDLIWQQNFVPYLD